MKRHWSGWRKRVKFIIVFGLLAFGAALYAGCGEEALPPPLSPSTGTITVTGGAV